MKGEYEINLAILTNISSFIYPFFLLINNNNNSNNNNNNNNNNNDKNQTCRLKSLQQIQHHSTVCRLRSRHSILFQCS